MNRFDIIEDVFKWKRKDKSNLKEFSKQTNESNGTIPPYIYISIDDADENFEFMRKKKAFIETL
jgi:hypothetical protein